MVYNLEIKKKVFKDLKKIDKSWQKKIIKFIENELVKDPYIGKKLIGNLSGVYKYRIGEYRVLYEIIEDEILISLIETSE